MEEGEGERGREREKREREGGRERRGREMEGEREEGGREEEGWRMRGKEGGKKEHSLKIQKILIIIINKKLSCVRIYLTDELKLLLSTCKKNPAARLPLY